MPDTDARQKYLKALGDHLSTWGPNCGAPQKVYEGHLHVLLRAHREMVEDEMRGKGKVEAER